MITGVKLLQYDVPFVSPFVTSRQTFTERIGLILQAVTDTGLTGYGEVAPLPGFSLESLSDCCAAAREFLPRLVNHRIVANPLDLAEQIKEFQITIDPLAFGVELLLADLAAQAAGIPLARWYREDALESISVNAVLTGDNLEGQVDEKLKLGFRSFKLKVGAYSLSDDLRRIENVRRAIGTSATLRLDANRAYDLATAHVLLAKLRDIDIEYIEEPLQRGSLIDLPSLRSDFEIPIAIDETLLEHSWDWAGNPATFERLLEAHDVAILKPTLMGGISRTMRFAESLRHAGKKIVITSSLDSGIGIGAALHLACALKLEAACGLSTGSGLTNQLVESPPRPQNGRLAIAARPGIGARLSTDAKTQQLLTEVYAS